MRFGLFMRLSISEISRPGAYFSNIAGIVVAHEDLKDLVIHTCYRFSAQHVHFFVVVPDPKKNPQL
jgi:hypothetical protein